MKSKARLLVVLDEVKTKYRSAGFQEIEPYPESEIPPEFQRHWVFMEKQL